MSHSIEKAAKIALNKRLREGWTVSLIATRLGLNSAHISNVVSQKRPPGPTLILAMIKHGWLPEPPPYPYFKIRNDDPSRAAKQLADNFDATFLCELAEQLLLHCVSQLEVRDGKDKEKAKHS